MYIQPIFFAITVFLDFGAALNPSLATIYLLSKDLEIAQNDPTGNGFTNIYANECFQDEYEEMFVAANQNWKLAWHLLYPVISAEEKLE